MSVSRKDVSPTFQRDNMWKLEFEKISNPRAWGIVQERGMEDSMQIAMLKKMKD